MRSLWGFLALAALPSFGQDSLDAYMRNLALAGNVQIENGQVFDPGLDANTRFELFVRSNWDYDLSVIKRNGTMELVVTPQFRRLDVSIKHRLRLPAEQDLNSARYRTLLLHEYDHVAISTDDRPRILLRELIRSIGTIRKTWNGPIPPPESEVNALIMQEMESRKTAVVSLIDFAYKKLDVTSDHGRRPIPNRSNLLFNLFGMDFLREAKFPFLGDAEKIAGSAEYLTARRYYRP